MATNTDKTQPLETAFLNLKTPPVTNMDEIQPNVTVVTGGQSLKGEKSILKGRHYTLDLPSREASGYLFMTSGGGNMLSQLKKALQNMKNGPWSVQGRDGDLTIKNRNYNQKPIASFTFFGGNGELLSFNAKTTRTEKTLDATSSSDVNPDDKSVTTVNTQGSSRETSTHNNDLPKVESVEVGGKLYFRPPANTTQVEAANNKIVKTRPGQFTASGKRLIKAYSPSAIKAQNKIINRNYSPTKEDQEAYIKQMQDKYNNLMTKLSNGDSNALVDLLNLGDLSSYITKRKEWVASWVDPASYWYDEEGNFGNQGKVTSSINTNAGKNGSSDYYYRWESGYDYLQKASNIKVIGNPNGEYRPDINMGGGVGKVQIAEYKEIEVPIDGARILTSAEPPMSKNEVVKSFQEEITGTFRIIGHPEIESEKIIEVKNVSKRYSGEWYIKNIKHRITPLGYFCDGQIIKKGSTIVTNTVVSNANMKKVWAGIAKLAKARVARDEAGITAESLVKQEHEKYKREMDKAGKKVSIDESFQAIVPDDYATLGLPETKKISIPVVSATQDVVNFRKSKKELKEQVKKIKGEAK